MPFLTRLSALLCVCFLTGTLFAERLPSNENAASQWPQWRGPQGTGVTEARGVPLQWSGKTGQNILWRLALPGPGGASPVVGGDQIYVTAADGERLLLLAVSTEGKGLWQRELGAGNRTIRGDEGNLASPSPSTDGQRVWSLMGNGLLGCFSAQGETLWQVDLQERYGKFDIQFGMASTPVLDGDRLYLQILHTAGQWVIALDKMTGEEIWKVARPTEALDECLHSYASPFLYRDSKQEYLISHGGDFAAAHQLSDGAEIWRCGALNPKDNYNRTLRFIASPTGGEGMIVIPSAKNGPVVALRPESKGDVSDNRGMQFWKRNAETPDVPTPVIHQGLVYLCRENGTLMCVDAKSGEEVYQKRLVADRHRASPVIAGGHLFCTARQGTVSVVKLGKEFELTFQNELNEDISATPAIVNGRIYLRSFQNLVAIGEK